MSNSPSKNIYLVGVIIILFIIIEALTIGWLLYCGNPQYKRREGERYLALAMPYMYIDHLNHKLLEQYARKSAELGNHMAAYILAGCLEGGYSDKPPSKMPTGSKLEEVIKWYLFAAEDPSLFADEEEGPNWIGIQLYHYYISDKSRLSKETLEKLKCYLRSKNGVGGVQVVEDQSEEAAAYLIAKGELTAASYLEERIKRWRQLVEDLYYAPAAVNLAQIYLSGPEKYRDKAEGLKMLSMAADRGLPAAQFALALAGNIIEGKKLQEIPSDGLNKSLSLMILSAQEGYAPAEVWLADYYLGLDDKKSQRMGMTWMYIADVYANRLYLNKDAILGDDYKKIREEIDSKIQSFESTNPNEAGMAESQAMMLLRHTEKYTTKQTFGLKPPSGLKPITPDSLFHRYSID